MKKLAALCQTWHVPIIPHVWGSGIGLAASLQVIATLPPTPLALNPIEPLLEYDCSDHPFRGALIHDAIKREEDGTVRVPAGAGLGVEIDEVVLSRFRTRLVG